MSDASDLPTAIPESIEPGLSIEPVLDVQLLEGTAALPTSIVVPPKLCPCGSERAFSECHGSAAPPGLITPPVIPCPCGSNKEFKDCHGALTAHEVGLVKPKSTVKLDLACGQNCRAGYEGVDLPGVPGVKHELNLLRFPWPWADNSVGEISCSHFIEHIPMVYVDEYGNYVPAGSPGARELFLAFFDEIYRVVEPGGWVEITAPNARSDRGFQDPTHRRFIVGPTFLYLSKTWRDANKLDHYNVKCDFDTEQPGRVNPGIWTHYMDKLKGRTPEVQAEFINERWNIVADWHAKFQSRKPAT